MQGERPMVAGARTVLSNGLARDLFEEVQNHILWLGVLAVLVHLL
jgi:hypothetical protein